jgi:dipeptidyl aminopeptidase/acylaminoacyl peptidase
MAVTKKYSLDLIDTYQVVADAQIHPDASCVAFSVSTLTHARGRNARANIWLADTNSKHTRAFTEADACEMHPRWSPDGNTLAFLSDRTRVDDFQIYLIPRAGGEARQLTHGNKVNAPYRDISMFKWSPDGTRIAYLAQDAEDEHIASQQAKGFDQIEFEAHPRFVRVWIVDVATGKTHVVTRGDAQVWELDWSPDGAELVLLCSAQPYEWSWYDTWLARVPARGRMASRPLLDLGEARRHARGIPRKIFARPTKQLAHPRWSPDGHHIAFVSSLWSDRGIISGDLYVTDVNGKNTRVLSEGFNGSLGDTTWLDAHTLLAAGFVEGQPALVQFDVEGASQIIWQGDGAIQESTAPKFSRAHDGTLAVVRSAPNQPREVWTFHPSHRDAQKWTPLTELNASFKQVANGAHEIVFWTSQDGQEMQGVLVRPPNAKPGKPLPLIVHPHGGPTGITANDYLSPARWVYHLTQRGFAIFMPNYRGSTGWGIAFAEANLGDLGGNDFQDIMTGIDALIERGIADPKRLGIGGWSYGGYLTAWAITQTNRFRAAVVGAGIVNWLSFHGTSYLCRWDELHYNANPYARGGVYDKFSPINFIENAVTPTLILHGEKDGDVPVSQGYELHRALKDHGVPTELVIYPREPHGVAETTHVKDLIQRVCAWFERYLKA